MARKQNWVSPNQVQNYSIHVLILNIDIILIVKILHCSNKLIVLLDALCCCQKNKVPYECLGYCMNVIAKGNEVDAHDATENDRREEEFLSGKNNLTRHIPPEWFLVR